MQLPNVGLPPLAVPPSALIAHISSVVRSTPRKTIVGSELAALIKYSFPEFRAAKYGCSNLRNFIQRFVPDVAEIGRQGQDCIYAPADLSTANSAVAPGMESRRRSTAINSVIWKTFVSPRSRYKLYAHSASSQIRAVPVDSVLEDHDWKPIASVSRERHVEIAKEFIDSLSNGILRDALTQHLSGPTWWVEYYEKVQQLGLRQQWNSFRQQKLLSELEAAMKSLGVSLTSSSIVETSQTQEAGAVRRSEVGEEKLRSLAARLIRKLPVAELRKLRFELGDVYDALGAE